MFECYTEKARRVIFFARYEASQLGAASIEAEHILLGLLREDRGLASRLFPAPAGALEAIRREIEGRIVKRPHVSLTIDLPLSNEAKQALSFADEEAQKLGDRHIGTEHLLLGLLRVEDSIATEILSEMGLQIGAVREKLVNLANEETANQAITQRLTLDEIQPQDVDEKWVKEISEACFNQGLFGPDDLVSEFQQVAALREFRADVEALLRLLAAKGMADSRNLPIFAIELRNEEKLSEFVKMLQQR